MVLESVTLLSHITYISIILLIGLLVSVLAKKLKLPDILLLVIVGIGFGAFIKLESVGLELPQAFIAGLSIFALILIVFEATAKIRLREFNWVSISALKVTFTSVALTFTILSFAALGIIFGFNMKYLFLSLLFGALMSGTAPDVLLSLVKRARTKALKVLEVESIINTPLTVILPLIIVDLQAGIQNKIISEFTTSLLVKVVSGLGAGLLVGLIVFKVMKNKYSERYSPIAVICAALVSYVLAENIGGNGIIAVTTLGLFFGNLNIKQKVSLLHFESVLTTLLKVLIFVLLGVLIMFPLSLWFFIKSIGLFLIFLGIRYLALAISAREFSQKERIFMTFASSKGMAVVVVTFILISAIGRFDSILNYVLAFILYSLILSSVALKFSKRFTNTKKVKTKNEA